MDTNLLNYSPTVEFNLKSYFKSNRALVIDPGYSIPVMKLNRMFQLSANPIKNVTNNPLLEKLIVQKASIKQQTTLFVDHLFRLQLGKRVIGCGFAPYLADTPLSRTYYSTLTRYIKQQYHGHKQPLKMELFVLLLDDSIYNVPHTTTFLWLKTTTKEIQTSQNTWIKEHWLSN